MQLVRQEEGAREATRRKLGEITTKSLRGVERSLREQGHSLASARGSELQVRCTGCSEQTLLSIRGAFKAIC